MIIDKLTNASIYYGMHPQVKKGLQFLMENDLDSLPVGKYEIEGDTVFALIQEYNTKPVEEGRYEAHYNYTDIQFVIQGAELMGYTNISETTVEEEIREDDIMFLKGSGDLLLVKEGYFAIFTPEDAHMPAISVNTTAPIKKALIKLRVN